MPRRSLLWAFALMAPAMLGDGGLPARQGGGVTAQAAGEWRALPKPAHQGPVSLEEALARRRSVREFSARRISDAQLSQLLWAAQGVTDAQGHRTAPSAGALYPLELYVATDSGLLRYDPNGHRVQSLAARDLRPAVQQAAGGQAAVGQAAVVFVVAAVYQRTAVRYGARAERYAHLEAGHAAQNVLLQAVSLGLGAVPVGAFDDQTLSRVLGLPPDQHPIYLIPVGWPRD